MLQIDPQTLAGAVNAEQCEDVLRQLGCTLDPARERLWIVPFGKIREAKQVASHYNYPAAFKVKPTK